MKNTKFKLDPRTKIFLLIIINITFFITKDVYYLCLIALIPCILLGLDGNVRGAIRMGIIYGISVLITYIILPNTHGSLHLVLMILSNLVYRMFPGLYMGYYLVKSTSISELIAAMERMKISQNIIIPLAVMFRFFPTIAEESRSIKDAMYMRGISFGSRKFFSNPFTYIEYRLIPLLMSTVKIGEELSAASLTRGLGSPNPRTHVCEVGFCKKDLFMNVVGLLMFIHVYL